MKLSLLPRLPLALAVLLFAGLPGARAYVLEGPQWPANKKITLQLQLGASTGALLDGAASWGASVEDALGQWNGVLGGGVKLVVVRDSTIPIVQGDGKNSVFFSDKAFGSAFGSGVVALTVYGYNISPAGVTTFTEADVVFNNATPFNSYRGPLHNVIGSLMFDFHRVALHEIGHLLGITHTPQNAQAIMTPVSTDIDALQADDIAGVQSLYGAPTPTPTPVPTPTPSPSPTPTPTPSPTPTPAPTPTPEPGTTPPPTPTPTPDPGTNPTPNPTPDPGASPTPSPTPVPTPSPVPVSPTVAAVVSAPVADSDAHVSAKVVITRTTDDLSQELKVFYAVKGATPGVDYAALSGAKKIKAGKDSATLVINALRHTGGRKLKITLQPSDDYQVSGSKVKVKLQ